MLGNTLTQVTNASSYITPSVIIILHLMRHLISSYDTALLNSRLIEPVSQCYNTNDGDDDDNEHYWVILHKILSTMTIKGLEKCNTAFIQIKNTQSHNEIQICIAPNAPKGPLFPLENYLGKLKWGSTSSALRWRLFKMCLSTMVMLSERYLHSLHRNSALEFLSDFWKTNN
jgi:hypothetical protein